MFSVNLRKYEKKVTGIKILVKFYCFLGDRRWKRVTNFNLKFIPFSGKVACNRSNLTDCHQSHEEMSESLWSGFPKVLKNSNRFYIWHLLEKKILWINVLFLLLLYLFSCESFFFRFSFPFIIDGMLFQAILNSFFKWKVIVVCFDIFRHIFFYRSKFMYIFEYLYSIEHEHLSLHYISGHIFTIGIKVCWYRKIEVITNHTKKEHTKKEKFTCLYNKRATLFLWLFRGTLVHVAVWVGRISSHWTSKRWRKRRKKRRTDFMSEVNKSPPFLHRSCVCSKCERESASIHINNEKSES